MRTSTWKNVATFAGALAALSSPHGAAANPENPAMYDARSVGMGGTGVAFLEGATGGVYHNPALLDGVAKFDAEVTVAPFMPKITAPIATPGTASSKREETEPTVVPLMLFGAGYRVHERVTVGLGAYVSSGVGGVYKNLSVLDAAATAPATRDDFDDLKLQVAVFEGALPVSVRVTPALSVGAAWRVGYTTSSTTVVVPNPAAPGLVNRVDQALNGFSLLGGSVGVRYRLRKTLALGASYRTNMKMALDGETDIEVNAAPPMVPTDMVVNADTTSSWRTPHQVRLGSSVSLLDETLMLVLEGRAQFYKSTNKTLESTIDLDGQPLMGITMMPELSVSNTLAWKNAYTAQLGAEYWLIQMLALRAGFTIGNSATPSSNPSPLTPTPGILYSFSAGIGGRWEHWDAGLAGWYMPASKDVAASDIQKVNGALVAPAGKYQGDLLTVAVSAGYRM